MYYLRVTVTLTSDLVFRIIMVGAYLSYYFRLESHIWCVNASWDKGVSRPILRSQTSTSYLVSKIGIKSGAYLLYYFR